jgi:hypothetical protein
MQLHILCLVYIKEKSILPPFTGFAPQKESICLVWYEMTSVAPLDPTVIGQFNTRAILFLEELVSFCEESAINRLDGEYHASGESLCEGIETF